MSSRSHDSTEFVPNFLSLLCLSLSHPTSQPRQELGGVGADNRRGAGGAREAEGKGRGRGRKGPAWTHLPPSTRSPGPCLSVSTSGSPTGLQTP